MLYPRDEDAVSAVASSLDIPNSMVPQMVIPGALLEERASELTVCVYVGNMLVMCKICSIIPKDFV